MAGLLLTGIALLALRIYADHNLELVARAISYTSEAAVVFHDEEAAKEALQAIVTREDVAQASIQLPSGRPLASWSRAMTTPWSGLEEYLAQIILPGPIEIGRTLWRDWPSLAVSLGITLQITFAALFVAAALGLLLAVLFAQSRLIELSLYPYAVILQVTPIVAIAPLIIIWVDDIRVALLICAWIVAFFPILSNTTVGLNSADHNLVDLFRLYRASRWQVLWRLRLPSAMPYFLAGLRISGGLALIGAITVVTMVCLLCAHWLGFGNGVNDGEFDGDGIEHEADNWRTHR
jgi:ABC-type nitrate/sulfonate/bicarbonate transport system permease component